MEFGVLVTKNVKKHSKYTHLVRLLCFLIKSVIHEFQHFGILETCDSGETIKHSLYTFLVMSFFP